MICCEKVFTKNHVSERVTCISCQQALLLISVVSKYILCRRSYGRLLWNWWLIRVVDQPTVILCLVWYLVGKTSDFDRNTVKHLWCGQKKMEKPL